MHLSFGVGEPDQMTEIIPFLARSRFFLDSSFSAVFIITDLVTFAYPAKRKEKKTVDKGNTILLVRLPVLHLWPSSFLWRFLPPYCMF